MEDDFKIVYRINDQDRIVFVNENWDRLALENDAPEMLSEKILFRSLWDFISGDTLQNLYRTILDEVRSSAVGGKPLKFNFRCDGAKRERLMEMSVSQPKNGEVQFETRLIRFEEKRRTAPPISEKDTAHMDKVIVICSWCNKIKFADGNWQEIEESLQNSSLFKLEILPHSSHGMCDECYRKVSKKFKK